MSHLICLRRPLAITLCFAGLYACLGTFIPAAGAESDMPPAQSFRRVFVPADSPEQWPVGSERYLPIPRDRFAEFLAELDAELVPRPETSRIRSAVFRATLQADGTLDVTAELDVSKVGDQPSLLPLSPLNLAIKDCYWSDAPEEPANVGWWQDKNGENTLGLEVSDAGRLIVSGRVVAKRSTASHNDYFLEKPIAISQTLELVTPEDQPATVTHAALIATDTNQAGEIRKVYQLAPQQSHRIRVRKAREISAPQTLPFVSQSTDYRLASEGLRVQTTIRLDARTIPINELRASLPRDLQVVSVSIDEQSADWRIVEDADGRVLEMSRPVSDQPQNLEIECLARSRRGVPWALPKLRFKQVAWTEGTTSLEVVPDLRLRSLKPRQATLLHVVGIDDQTSAGEVYRLQEWTQESAVEVDLERPSGIPLVDRVTEVDLARNQAQARVIAELSATGGDVYQVQAVIAPNWSIDSVTATPASALNEWHVDQSGSGSQVNLQFNQPISGRSPLRLEIAASEVTGGTVLPCQVQQLQIIDFPNARLSRDVLRLRPPNLEQLNVADHLARATIAADESDTLLAPQDENVASPLSGALTLDLTRLNATDRIEFREQPAAFVADVRVVVDALPKSLKHTYSIACQLTSGAVSELLVEFDSPPPAEFRWSLVRRGVEIPLDSVLEQRRLSGTRQSEIYRILLPSLESEHFELRATSTQSAQTTERCALVRLPGATTWRGQVVLRGPLKALKVHDQGWAPAIPDSGVSASVGLYVVGSYRLGSDETRRGGQPTPLSFTRREVESVNPSPFAWLAEYQTLQAANGTALQSAGYLLENTDGGQARIKLPLDAELHEAWLDEQQLDLAQLESDDGDYLFNLAGSQRWIYLGLKFSTPGVPLHGTAVIQPAVPECSFPINSSRWTLWAPENYEIDQAEQSYSVERTHWWKRLFGPLARSREQKLFNPLRFNRWHELWSAPLTVQQIRQYAEDFAKEFAASLQENPTRTIGAILGGMTADSHLSDRTYVDSLALMASGIHHDTLASDQQEVAVVTTFDTRARPLSSYQLAVVVSRNAIVLTTSERVAHWHRWLRPTKTSGLYWVVGDDLADRLDHVRLDATASFSTVLDWLGLPTGEGPTWDRMHRAAVADAGRQALTVEFVAAIPAFVVHQAHVQRALWYGVLLLTIVIGAWKLAHYPNAMILAGAAAGATCLTIPARWLAVPQAIFLGLLAAAIIRVVRKSAQLHEEQLPTFTRIASARTALFVLVGILLSASVAVAQPVSAKDQGARAFQNLPRVLIPIDSEGRRVGDDVYLSERYREQLLQSMSEIGSYARLVILEAKYDGKLLTASSTNPNAGDATEPWSLQWKIESSAPNQRLRLPLNRSDADWDPKLHRLDGLPVQIQWYQDGEGCSLSLPDAGVHWLRMVARPKIRSALGSNTVRLSIPSVPVATLNLTDASDEDDIQVRGAASLASEGAGEARQYRLLPQDALEVRWRSSGQVEETALWEQLTQLAWLQVESGSTWLDVQLSVRGFRSPANVLELEISPQLQLTVSKDDPLIEKVEEGASGLPNRIRLTLRSDLDDDFDLPLRFEFQRAANTGRIFFPRVNVVGAEADQNLFAVSVAAGLTSAEDYSGDLRRIEPQTFVSSWNRKMRTPLYAYSVDQSESNWSLDVWPDPVSIRAQHSIQLYCAMNRSLVEYKAEVSDLVGDCLMHRIQVPPFVQIESVIVEGFDPSDEVPLRWTRSSPQEAIVFLGRPLNEPHTLKLQGYLESPLGQAFAVPEIQLRASDPGSTYVSLYRDETVRVQWADAESALSESVDVRLPPRKDAIQVGSYRWRPARNGVVPSLVLEANEQEYEARSVTTLDADSEGWNVTLSSQIVVIRGIVNQLTLTTPAGLGDSLELLPAGVGVLGKTISKNGNRDSISITLARSLAAGEQITVQLSGRKNLPADQRVTMPSLRWSDAARQASYVLLPSSTDDRRLTWRTSGLQRATLPRSLAEFTSENDAEICFRVQQQNFVAQEWAFRGGLQRAQIRHARMSGVVGEDGRLLATAELVLQPGRATSCEIQLPTDAELRQLVVGDSPARREQVSDSTWQVAIGPPYMPQRLVVSYRCDANRVGDHVELQPPHILIGDQTLPMSESFWLIRSSEGVQLRLVHDERSAKAENLAKGSYRRLLLVAQDALSQAVELPKQERQVWARTWLAILRRARGDWHALSSSSEIDGQLPAEESILPALDKLSSVEGDSQPSAVSGLSYPPQYAGALDALVGGEGQVALGDASGALLVRLTATSDHDIWQWFGAFGLVSVVIAVVSRLRHYPSFYHDLCRWPHALSLAGGFLWWLLLEPSALGMLVIAIAIISLLLKYWRAYRLRNRVAAIHPVVASVQ